MKTVFVSCTPRAYGLAAELEGKWKEKYPGAEVEHIVKCAALPELSIPEKESLREAVGRLFETADLIVFFTAAGIAVRSIAPFIMHKSVDPAVVTVDECARYAISLLSGHHGGANRYAREIAGMTGAEPVVTTATDGEGKFAVDEFARVNHLEITDWDMAKRISAGLLSGGEAALYDADRRLIARTKDGRMPECGIVISNKARPNEETCGCKNVLRLIPKNIYLGIGCKKGTESAKIQEAVRKALELADISPNAVAKAASIDLKEKEPGILEFCEQHGIEYVTFPADELMKVEGSVSSSAFVRQIAGVDNVCERSALAAGGDRLILPKQIYEGVTVAIAESDYLLRTEEGNE